MAIIIRCDVCSRCINERSAGWVKVETHRGDTPRVNHYCAAACAEVALGRTARPVSPETFAAARETLADARDRKVAEAWEQVS